MDGIFGGRFAVDKGRHLAGERSMGFASAGIGFVLGFERCNRVLTKKGKVLQVADDIAIVHIDEVLKETVHAGALRV